MMKRSKIIFPVLVLVFSLPMVGCNLPKSKTDIPPAPTVAQAQPTTPPEPIATPVSGIPISYNNFTFTIPLELNASASPSTNTDVEFPYINPSGGPMAEHVVFQITNYPVQGVAKIMVFKTSDYAAYGEPTQNAVTALLGNQEATQPLPHALAQDFYAQAKTVSFKNGHGVRYLTQILTNFAPIDNQDLFYYYQGVTTDGAYFVSALFHVNAPFLVADGKIDSLTPADGIPFKFDGSGDQDFSKYLTQITQKLNETPPEKFAVPLAVLDQMIESIKIEPPK
jgi:hypothetical protein